ncbi:MAG: cytidylate kinase-like family protein [Actinobacteria bacterium]|nr:cytidylate kinase-like family protein [Actinomycetota bacterium]
MSVVTFSRFEGSGGFEIARNVSARLGYKFADKELVQRIMEQYSLFDFKKIYDEKLSFWEKYSTVTFDILSFFDRVIRSIAKNGNAVIVGRGSFFSLAEYSDVLNVMIHAPLETRVRTIMERDGLSDFSAAEKMVREQDNIRKSFIEITYNVKWNRLNNFDLVFNTAKIDPGTAVEMIISAVQSLEKNISPGASLTKDIKEDEVLDKVVRDVLND